MSDSATPLSVDFFSLYPGSKEPTTASRDLGGSMQARAARLCAPYTEASGFGWYIYPPVDFAVRWTGDSSQWSLLDGNEPTAWRDLAGGVTDRLPFSDEVLAAGRAAGISDLDIFDKYDGLPFIEADPRNSHMLEIIPGLLARTSPGWRLLLRAVPNATAPLSYQLLEGIVETDWYRAYLPIMLQLRVPGEVVRFHARRPIMVAQPVPAEAMELARSRPGFYAGLDQLPAEAWSEFMSWRRLKQDPESAAQYVRHQKSRRRKE